MTEHTINTSVTECQRELEVTEFTEKSREHSNTQFCTCVAVCAKLLCPQSPVQLAVIIFVTRHDTFYYFFTS